MSLSVNKADAHLVEVTPLLPLHSTPSVSHTRTHEFYFFHALNFRLNTYSGHQM